MKVMFWFNNGSLGENSKTSGNKTIHAVWGAGETMKHDSGSPVGAIIYKVTGLSDTKHCTEVCNDQTHPWDFITQETFRSMNYFVFHWKQQKATMLQSNPPRMWACMYVTECSILPDYITLLCSQSLTRFNLYAGRPCTMLCMTAKKPFSCWSVMTV